MVYQCLNPYSTGSNSIKELSTKIKPYGFVLILILLEVTQSRNGFIGIFFRTVLILILLEVTQSYKEFELFGNANGCLNPYSTGSNSIRNKYVDRNKLHSVLILILLEVTQSL